MFYVQDFNLSKWEVFLQCKMHMALGGSVSKESTCNAGDAGLIPCVGKIPGRGNGNPLQYSCLENLVDKGAWWAVVHGGHKELGMTEELNTSHSYCSHADILFLFVTLRTDLLRYVIY